MTNNELTNEQMTELQNLASNYMQCVCEVEATQEELAEFKNEPDTAKAYQAQLETAQELAQDAALELHQAAQVAGAIGQVIPLYNPRYGVVVNSLDDITMTEI